MKKVLKIYKSIVIENFKPVSLCSIKWRPFKVFAKLHKSPLLIANIVKETIFGNWKPLKIGKMCFSFKYELFVLKIFRFLFWLFDHLEKTAWLER